MFWLHLEVRLSHEEQLLGIPGAEICDVVKARVFASLGVLLELGRCEEGAHTAHGYVVRRVDSEHFGSSFFVLWCTAHILSLSRASQRGHESPRLCFVHEQLGASDGHETLFVVGPKELNVIKPRLLTCGSILAELNRREEGPHVPHGRGIGRIQLG